MRLFELVFEEYQDGRVKRGGLTFRADVAARWRKLGLRVEELGKGHTTEQDEAFIKTHDASPEFEAFIAEVEQQQAAHEALADTGGDP